MEKWTNFLLTFKDQVVNFWSKLSMGKRISLVSFLGLAIVAIASLFAFTTKEKRDYLYQNLADEDIQAIASELKKLGEKDFTIDAQGIKVPEERVLPLRIQLSQEGLPSHGQIGWEKFDQQDFTSTEFEQKINKRRAIEGELARTIGSVEGIMSARVHIVEAKQSLFVEDQKDPTAAIYIKTKRGVELAPKQINGVVHLVSRSVEGLKPEKVTIIDQNGKLLTKVESDDPESKKAEEMIEYRNKRTKDLEEKVTEIVSRIVGPDRVEAKVDLEIDFTTEEQTMSDIDPDKVVVIASNTTAQELDGSGLNPTGIPGAKSNVPGEQEPLGMSGNKSQSKRNSERINYEVAKKQSHRIMPFGNILRISAAVLVDGKQPYPIDGTKPVFEPRTDDEMKKIEELVKSAIGFKDGRDMVKVHNLLFQPAPFQIEAIKEKKTENRNYISTLAVSAVAALAIVFFFAFVVRPYFRWLSYDPERKSLETKVEEFRPDLELGSIQNVQVKEDIPFEKLSPQEQILYLAKHEPKRTTEAIRMLLNPQSSSPTA
ncbi:MAG: flagellar basal-body MS-ring/collar protein FliF [Oligoflexales bacterium]